MKKLHSTLLTLITAAAAAAAAVPAAAETSAPAAQVNALFRVLKADGKTVIGQVVVAPGWNAQAVIAVRQADAIVAANGRCAFNVRYDEVSTRAASGTVNRLYSNDVLVAQNSGIDLQAGVLRSITTQPYLFAGNNNVKLVLNAESAAPSVAWLRIVVDGQCKSVVVAPPPAASTPTVAPKPAEPPVVPGTGYWNALYNAWGYSNYAVTQLRGKGYARYADVAAINAALTAAVTAKTIDRVAYDALMARWNALAADAGFRAAMAAIMPPGTAGRI